MIAAAVFTPDFQVPASCLATMVREEKVSHYFMLHAQRRRWYLLFDAVAGAALVIGGDRALTSAETTELTVAAIFGAPDEVITEITTLVTRVVDAIAAGERETLVSMLNAGKPRTADEVWATVGKMVEIVRRVRPLDDATVDRLFPVIHLIGEHPFMRIPD